MSTEESGAYTGVAYRRTVATPTPAPTPSARDWGAYLLSPERAQRFELLMHLIANLGQPLVVCGPEGIGKTTFLWLLGERAFDSWRVINMPTDGRLSHSGIIAHIAEQLGLVGHPESAVTHYLQQRTRNKDVLVLLLDDAGKLAPGIITGLWRFARANPALRLVFALCPDEAHLKSTSDGQALKDCRFVDIPPLSELLCEAYVRRLTAMRSPRLQLADDDAIAQHASVIYHASHGVPGRIYQLLTEAPPEQPKRKNRTPLLVAYGVATLAAAALLYPWYPAPVPAPPQAKPPEPLSLNNPAAAPAQTAAKQAALPPMPIAPALTPEARPAPAAVEPAIPAVAAEKPAAPAIPALAAEKPAAPAAAAPAIPPLPSVPAAAPPAAAAPAAPAPAQTVEAATTPAKTEAPPAAAVQEAATAPSLAQANPAATATAAKELTAAPAKAEAPAGPPVAAETTPRPAAPVPAPAPLVVAEAKLEPTPVPMVPPSAASAPPPAPVPTPAAIPAPSPAAPAPETKAAAPAKAEAPPTPPPAASQAASAPPPPVALAEKPAPASNKPSSAAKPEAPPAPVPTPSPAPTAAKAKPAANKPTSAKPVEAAPAPTPSKAASETVAAAGKEPNKSLAATPPPPATPAVPLPAKPEPPPAAKPATLEPPLSEAALRAMQPHSPSASPGAPPAEPAVHAAPPPVAVNRAAPVVAAPTPVPASHPAPITPPVVRDSSPPPVPAAAAPAPAEPAVDDGDDEVDIPIKEIHSYRNKLWAFQDDPPKSKSSDSGDAPASQPATAPGKSAEPLARPASPPNTSAYVATAPYVAPTSYAAVPAQPAYVPPPPPPPAPAPRPAAANVSGAGVSGVMGADWLLAQSPRAYTLRIMSARSPASVQALLERSPMMRGHIASFRTRGGAAELYPVYYGIFASQAEAAQAMAALPSFLGKPMPRQMNLVQQEIRAGQ